MTLPALLGSGTFTDGELTNEVKWYTRVFQTINALITFLSNAGAGYLADLQAVASPVTLTAAATNFIATSPSVTITLATQRRVRIYAASAFTSGTAIGHYRVWPAYQSGGSITAGGATVPVTVGASLVNTSATGANGGVAASAETTVLLPAGTYTFAPVVQRVANGSATDTASGGYIAVYDVSAS